MRVRLFPSALFFLVLSFGASFAHASFSFTTNFSEGSSGPQVYVLQQVLNRDADTRVANSGPGSPGQETSYFGLLTQAAVMRFQQKYASQILIPAGLSQANGFVGFYTRAVLNSLLSNIGTVTPPVTPPPPPPPPSLTPSSSGTTIPSATQIVDSQLNTWTESNDLIYRNNVPVSYSSTFSLLLYYNTSIYQENTLCAWWVWNGSSWVSTSSPSPDIGPSCTPPTQAINGTCGSSNNATLSSAPTDLCSSGSPSYVNGSGPWTWSCLGSGGGNNVSCSANKASTSVAPPVITNINPTSGPDTISPYPVITGSNLQDGAQVLLGGIAARAVSGASGTDNTHYLVFQPPLVSTVGAVDVKVTNPDGGTATLKNGWTYTSASGGGNPTNGACGSSNGTTVSSAPTTNLCSAGSASTVNGTGPWSWSCLGTNGGNNVSCSAAKGTTAVNGSCGSSNGTTLSSAPTSGLCSIGSASNVSGSGPWSWSCSGSNGGSAASCSASKTSSGGGGGGIVDNYPRLGAYLIGGAIDYANMAHIRDLQVAVFTTWPGYSVGGKNFQQQVAAVKAMNPNMKITVYAKINSANLSLTAFQAEYDALGNNNWWLRKTWPNGSIVTAFGGTENAINIFVSAARAWLAAYFVSFETATAPNLDGIYTDNVNQSPREDSDGDFLKNGTTQSQTDPTIEQDWRNAYAAWDAQLRSAMGSQYMDWGNVADWGVGSIQGYNQLLNGGVMESAIGQSYSYESSSWATLMNYYKTVMNSGAPFKGGGPYFIFQQDGSTLNSGTYQAARYGLTSCLLDNAYYHYNTVGPGGGNNVAWLDEMGVNLGAAMSGPNNPTNGTYSNGGLTVWKQGVWRRDFANGIALVNPKGNGPQTVTLETTYKHFSGTQNPLLNNGQSVTSVTLNDRDGVILLRD